MTIQFTPARDARSRARAHKLAVGAANARQQRLEAMRGQATEKTVPEWAAELGATDRMIRRDLSILGESAKPMPPNNKCAEPMSAANFDHSVMAAWLHRPIR